MRKKSMDIHCTEVEHSIFISGTRSRKIVIVDTPFKTAVIFASEIWDLKQFVQT